ncbi:uncharacterized protein BYT42DRAFT_488343 [Radiomyces spectabilis]|uniref:uncharacterized protein n=1 Tax=Radiomyces spectabilis TaxID=64574 RepID=UPI0022201586|nr:uncharacterized protein BYT42DRAFT_488343 [Radiomyces spectabilis]KAI8393775.1 hypothetical protein BYT42DRAFT_488343 [Radiomyces spectabilis]
MDVNDPASAQQTVYIRSPTLSETLTLTVPRDATLLSLKRIIQDNHPQKPSPANQRIIYSGKLLDDDVHLSAIFAKLDMDVVPTLHLVVKPSLQSAYSANKTPTMPVGSVPISLSNPSQPLSSESASTSNMNAPPSQPNLPVYPPLLPGGYQLVALNGQYYLAPVLVPTEAPPLNQPPHTQSVYSAQPNMPFPPSNAPANAAVPNVEPDRPIFAFRYVARATSIWLALKLIFVLFIICQGASLERILLFHAMAFVFFLYQTGRLRLVIHHASSFRDPSSSAEGQASGSTAGDQPADPPRRTFLHSLKRGTYTFIASLWPSYGQDRRVVQAFDNAQ